MVVWALWSVVSSFTPPLSSGSATQHSGSRKACSVHGVEITTLRQDALKGWISKESPVGRAVMGRKAGDRVYVDMGSGKGYYLQIRAIEKGTDNGDIPIGSF